MNREFLIVPSYEGLEDSFKLSKAYNASFEYDDFYAPAVYQDEREICRRISGYKSLDRDRSRDTLHGVFIDTCVSSPDKKISSYSKSLFRLSMDIAKDLGVRGVVFHTGLISGLEIEPYLSSWLDGFSGFMEELSREYPSLSIFIENSFEKSPNMLLRLKNSLPNQNNIKLCLDVGHASLTPYPLEKWCEEMSPYTAHIHLNDNDLKNDLHLATGRGSLDFQNIKLLLDRFFKGVPILLELDGIENQRLSLDFMQGL